MLSFRGLRFSGNLYQQDNRRKPVYGRPEAGHAARREKIWEGHEVVIAGDDDALQSLSARRATPAAPRLNRSNGREKPIVHPLRRIPQRLKKGGTENEKSRKTS
jgi:hypothetical protein